MNSNNQTSEKNILYINFSGGWGGLEIFSYELFMRMSRAGYNIYFAVRSGEMLSTKLTTAENPANIIEFSNVSAFNISNYFRLKKIIQKNNIQIIHTFKSSDIRFSVISSKFLGLKNIRIIHHLQMLPTKPRLDTAHRLIYKHLDKLCVITEQMKQAVKQYWPVRENIIETVYHCIDIEKFEKNKPHITAIRKKYGLPLQKKIIGIAGQVTEGKGQHILLEAFKKLCKKRNDIFLVIAGAAPKGEENYYKMLENFIKENNLADKAVMLGYCDNIPELMVCFDIFAFASRNETFGLVLIEAMAAGCITIGVNAGGVPEIITDLLNGFLYPPFDACALKSVIEKILEFDDQQLNEIRANAYKILTEKFSVCRFTEQMKKIYD